MDRPTSSPSSSKVLRGCCATRVTRPTSSRGTSGSPALPWASVESVAIFPVASCLPPFQVGQIVGNAQNSCNPKHLGAACGIAFVCQPECQAASGNYEVNGDSVKGASRTRPRESKKTGEFLDLERFAINRS